MINSQFIQNCQAGDEGAVQTLVRTYQRPVFQLALSVIDDAAGSPEGSQDSSMSPVTQAEIATRETFITALDRLGRYREDTSFEVWLYAIAVEVSRRRYRVWKARLWIGRGMNGLISLITRSSTKKPVDPRTGIMNEPRFSPGDAEMWAVVRSLPGKLRLPVVLRYYHDFSIGDTARVLRVSEGLVHAQLDAARERIAKRLEK
jgi:RNA polymerase sigma-70 factor (ECF subfamily)